MSAGSFLSFGLGCVASASLLHIAPELRYSNAFLQAREHNKIVLPPHEGGLDANARCVAVAKLCGPSLVLLEDGQVHDLDLYANFEPWVADAFAKLNALRLQLVDVVVGGVSPSGGSAATKLSSAASGPVGNFFLARTALGEVWVFGLNTHGQLGLGHTRDVHMPTRLDKFAPTARAQSNIAAASQASVPCAIVALAAGKAHSLALTADGAVYAFGRNAEGQLGLVQAAKLRTIQAALDDIDSRTPSQQQAAAAERANLVQEQAAEEATLGRAHALQQLAAVVTPRFVHHFAGEAIVSISACNHLSAAIDAQGRVYHWGYGLVQRQMSVPTVLQFASKPTPKVTQMALGHSHALLLADGVAYALGSGLSGALGLGVSVAKRVEAAQPITVVDDEQQSTVEEAIVQVYAGSFYSALLDARGRVFTFGSGDGGKLGGSDSEENVFSPRLLGDAVLGAQTVGALLCGDKRLLAFVPTKLTKVEPSVVALSGGTSVRLGGQGFFERGSKSGQVVASFTYLGHTIQVSASYDPLTDSLQATAPSFVDIPNARGGVYRDAHLENCIVRVSMDGGAHASNALALHVFHTPDFAAAAANPEAISINPSCGPIEGGSTLALRAPFDMVPYEHVLIRFRSGSGEVIDTVQGQFDPIASVVRCTAPKVPSALVPPSLHTASAASGPSRFRRAVEPSPPASLLDASLEVSLDGQTFFPFPLTFAYYAVAGVSITPSALGLAGGALRILASGLHFTGAMQVRLGVGTARPAIVPATFLALGDAREAARATRERTARAERKRRADAREVARLAAIQAALDEEENRDPKEKERLAREKEKQEKEREREAIKQREREAAAAKKEATAAAAAAAERDSRPSSAASQNGTNTPSRPRSSTGTKSHAASRVATPSGTRPTSAVLQPASLAAVEAVTAAPVDQEPTVPELDEFDDLETQVAAEEAAQDALLARLSPRDQAATGYILCDAPPFTSFGACRPVISVSLNGGRDFVPLTQLATPLEVRAPQPLSLSPMCGPTSGGTRVLVSGDFFYQASHAIQVQLREVPAPTPVSTRPSSAIDGGAEGSKPSSRSVTSPTPKKVSAASRNAPPVVVEPVAPVAPLPPQTTSALFEVTSLGAGLSFTTPAWPVGGLTSAHVAFDPRENAFSRSAPGVQFRFYETPLVQEAHPLLVSQAGGTEVTLGGRGFIDSRGDCRVRLTLLEEEDKKGGHKPSSAAASHHDGDATPLGGSSARRKLGAASAHAAFIEDAAALEARRRALPRMDVLGTYHANLPGDEPEPLKKKPVTTHKKKEGELEPEPGTISFVVPQATVFNPDFADGSGVNRALEVELALNGAQFIATGIVLRFEKDTKPKKKVEPVKK